jgi:hypothetical protein
LLDEQGTREDELPPPQQVDPIHNEPRRSARTTIPNRNLQDYDVIPDTMVTPDGDIVHLALFVDTEPISYAEASNHHEWREAMQDEIEAI